MSSPRKPRAPRAPYQAVYDWSLYLSRRSGRYPYFYVLHVQDASGAVVCDDGVVRVTAAELDLPLRKGDVVTFEARHIVGRGEVHEFIDTAHVTPGNPPV